MLAKRIIPCLDVDKGNVVKGVNFVNLKKMGDPVELAKYYNDNGADELVFLDITASYENRDTTISLVKELSKYLFIPFTIGGGVRTVDDVKQLLRAGADKVSINSAAITNPNLIEQVANQFGNQCVVVAIDVKRTQDSWDVYIKGGRKNTAIDVFDWAKKAESLGAGELLVTSMDRDGTKIGFDLELYQKLSSNVNIPIIASGGCGNLQDFRDVLTTGCADAALAASLFHSKTLSLKEVKLYLRENKVEVRV